VARFEAVFEVMAMNLSERLDAARTKREQGDASKKASSQYDLRMGRDARTYDGTNLRTGKRMTREEWEQLEAENAHSGPGLPTWNPRRAHEEFTVLEATPDSGESRTTLTPDPAPRLESVEVAQPVADVSHEDDEFALPAWAADVKVYDAPKGSDPATTETDASTCPTCGHKGRVVHVDLIDDEARLECEFCGLIWQKNAKAAYDSRT
jgi:hypothetical protein